MFNGVFEIINEFHAIISRKPEENAVFKTLNNLIQYTEEHFRDEERLMEQGGYPEEDLNFHRMEHERLVKEIFDLDRMLEDGCVDKLCAAEFISEMETFLDNWLIRHILEKDKDLIEYADQMRNLRP